MLNCVIYTAHRYAQSATGIKITLNIINICKRKILIVLLLFNNVLFLHKLRDMYNIKSLNSLCLIIENKRYKTIIALKSFN